MILGPSVSAEKCGARPQQSIRLELVMNENSQFFAEKGKKVSIFRFTSALTFYSVNSPILKPDNGKCIR